MKKCMLVLTSGVTIEFKEGDVIHIGCVDGEETGKVDLQNIPLFLNLGKADEVIYIDHITYDNEREVNVEYYLPSEKISWCYVQTVKEVETVEKN